jgi:arylsulfatase A-like enzyme
MVAAYSEKAWTSPIQNGNRPNILFVIGDDISWPHMSAYGSELVSTPGFDRVAREGILFNNAFTPNPKCSPSRACILTGRNTWELEEACNHFGIFSSKFKVYTNILQESGYHVGFTGKGWAPGDWKSGGFTHNPAGPEYNEHKLKPPFSGINSKDYTTNFKAFLDDRKEDQPFCFWYGGHEAHRIYEEGIGLRLGKKLGAASIRKYYPDHKVVRSDILDYAIEVEYFDKHLVNMLNILEEREALENTLVVVTTDNGMPFPRVKGQIYEDDFHLPLAIRWGNEVQGGRVVDDFVSFIDFAPTFLEVAGLSPLPEMTGKSLLKILESNRSGQIEPDRDIVFVGKERHDLGRPDDVGYPVRAARTKEFLYIRNFKPSRWPAGNPETDYGNIDASPTKTLLIEQNDQGISKYYDLSMGKRALEELYNIKEDPDCIKNLAEDPSHAEIKRRLWAKLKATLTEQRDPRILGNGDVFDVYRYTGGRRKAYDSWERSKRRE